VRPRPRTTDAGGCGLLPLRGPDLQVVEQRGGGGRDGVDRVTERLGVVPGGRAETADLPHVLQRGGADIVVGHLLGVGRAKGLDAPAHSYDRTWPVRTVLTPSPGLLQVRAYSKSGLTPSPSSPSRPTVRPTGREPIRRTASSTPGMNDVRSRESCLIVSVSPCPPNSTSWCATSPATRTECTCTSSTVAPRAPDRDDAVASGGAPRPAAARAAPIKDAVRSAVPDGASALAAWCNSITSAESKNLAACTAKRIIKMAPTEKFGTTRTCTSGCSVSQPRTSSSRSSANPDVPTTTSRSWAMHQRRFSMTTPG